MKKKFDASVDSFISQSSQLKKAASFLKQPWENLKTEY